MSLSSARELARDYRRDGVVCLRGALDAPSLALAERCFDWSRAHPTNSACRFYEGDDATFFQDLCHPQAAHAYRELLERSPVADLVAALWGAPEVWFLYEQVFVKEGAATRRTPWHQDASYLALDGERVAVMWINFDPVDAAHSLEFVRGSHRGTLYNGSAFDPEDDTAPIFAAGLPRLPDIEAERERWDIVSWPVAPGDVVVFHPQTLHGGAPTAAGTRRRTLSLRFFGDDAVYAARPEQAPAPLVAGLHDTLAPGDPFRHPAFPQLRPAPAGFDAIPAAGSGHATTLRTQMQTGAGS
ncbi:MAG: phytanoyl-CoA dioxygenase family protein [Gammaproteobacteria bacterium]